MSERYYSGIGEVKELRKFEDVNTHLASKDWELLGIKERDEIQADTVVRQVIYVMGLKTFKDKKEEQPQKAAEVDSSSLKTLIDAVEKLPWKEWKSGGGAWIYSDPRRYTDNPEKGWKSLTAEQSSIVTSLLTAIGPDNLEFTLGLYSYKQTGENNMFLSRRLIKK